MHENEFEIVGALGGRVEEGVGERLGGDGVNAGLSEVDGALRVVRFEQAIGIGDGHTRADAEHVGHGGLLRDSCGGGCGGEGEGE